jgi:hypothetical protein
MDDEIEEPRSPKREQLSKTPSWVMLGFVLGAACVLAWPRKPELRLALTATPAPTPVEKRPPPPLTVDRALFFENVFAEWATHAAWENELTEVAFWNAETKSFSDRFEVFRSGERYYFRSISQFTRPLLTHGDIPGNSPLQFTEPQAAREQWLKENSAENFRKFIGDPTKKD